MKCSLLKKEIEVIIPDVCTSNNFYNKLISQGYVFVENAFDVNSLNLDFKNNNLDTTIDSVTKLSLKNNLNLLNFITSSCLIQELKKNINPLYCQDFLFLRKKKNSLGTKIHRDGDDLVLREDKNINLGSSRKSDKNIYTIWISLSDISPHNSTLCLLNYEDELVKVDNYWVEDIDKILAREKFLDKHTKWVTVNMKAGDAVIFSSDIVHASTDCLEGMRTSLDLRVSAINLKNEILIRFNKRNSYKEHEQDEVIVL